MDLVHTENRTKNTKRNIIFSYVDSFITIGFQFLSRSIIVHTFSSQYLGLTSLFTSVLQVLNMADLGFASAIIYNMYRPMAEHDVDAVCALLNYYRKVYRVVGSVILVCGILVMPILPYLMKKELPEGINMYVLYLLYLSNTVISYFLFAYKTALLNALQRLDLTKLAYAAANIIQSIFQIVCLTILKNFYIFVGVAVIGTVFKNVFCACISKSKFPEYFCLGEVASATRKDVVHRVKGLFICNVSGVTYTAFDSIILSTFLGLSTVAVYNNYITVFNGVMSFVVLLRNAMQASVGNSIASESREKNYRDMILWQFLFSVIAIWCVTCLFSLYQPFMELWMGLEMLLPVKDVVLLCVWFFLSLVPHAFYLYLSGNGLWWEMKWSYILSTGCNLVLNITLGKLYGTTGIIFSTVVSSLIFGMIWQCVIVFKIYFIKSMREYFRRQIFYAGICLLSAVLAYILNHFILIDGMSGIIVKGMVCTFVSALLVILLCRESEIYKRAVTFVRLAIHV